MPNWHSFEPSRVFPTPLLRAVQSFSAATSAVTRAGQVTSKALGLTSRLVARASQSPAEAAIRTALSEVDRFIQELVSGTQAHMIVIPLRKRVFVAPRKGAIEAIEDFVDPDEDAMTLIQQAKSAVSGPPMFFRTLAESVGDAGDAARPQFPATYATAGVCLLAGAETLSDLNVPVRLFTSLFGGNVRLPPASNVLPVVQNVRVIPIASRGGVGVVIRWDPLSAVRTVPLYIDDAILAKEIFVIRVEGAANARGTAWDDLFPGVTPGGDPTAKPSNSVAKVVARIPNHGFVVSYTETEDLLDPEKTYFYTTSVRYEVNGDIQPMGPLSNFVRVTRSQPAPTSSRGVPPDWIATGSLIQLIPPLNEVVGRLRLGMSRVGSRTVSNAGPLQMVQQTVRQLERTIQQWEDTNRELSTLSDRLQSITASGNATTGIYATVISKTSGGVPAWLAELSRRLSDDTDDSRPELSDQASVIGVVILAGAPRLPDLSAFLALLNLLFGDKPSNPLLTVLRQINGNPAEPASTQTATNGQVLGYDAAMRPSPLPTC